MSEDRPDIDWNATTWDGSRRAQLRRALELTIRERLEAMEGLAEVARRFREMRAQGGFKNVSERTDTPSVKSPSGASEPAVRYGSSDGRHEVVLDGCTPEPLMNYLKALGILRLVASDAAHGDESARGYWMNDRFVLRSRLDRSALRDFFLDWYAPTPIVAPWGARSGFYAGSSETAAREALGEIMQTEAERFEPFRSAVRLVHELLAEAGLTDKAKDDGKLRLLHLCRRRLPDPMLDWLDACYSLTSDGRKFPPLLGTGGNEGSGSYVSGFARQVVACVIRRQHDPALDIALFGGARDDISSSQMPGHFSPGAAGGPNAGQGLSGHLTTNPWDYLLCLEGTCLWASGVVRRFGQRGPSMAAFPFTVNVTGAGASLSLVDGAKPNQAKREIAEVWLPLWPRPMALDEIRGLLFEGRATVGRRLAESGVDLARAAAGLGVERGITEFQRTAFLMRNGQSFLAIGTGRFPVQARPDVDLLGEIDRWLGRFRKACKLGQKGEAPARLTGALRRIDNGILDYCRYGGRRYFQLILIALGQAERELMRDGSWAAKNTVPQLAGLSAAWAMAADDRTAEFELALALAGVHDSESKLGPLRANLEPVRTDRERAVVWSRADLAGNMAAVLARRLMDGDRAGCKRPPLDSRAAASLDVIAAFIAAEVDDSRVADLLWGLMLVDGLWPTTRRAANTAVQAPPLPRAYALLKLLFLPHPLTRDRKSDGTARWRYARHAERGIEVRPEPRILPLLLAGRLPEACEIAMRRLHASGLTPMPHYIAWGSQARSVWSAAGGVASGDRLAASLLVPIASSSVDRLVALVTRPNRVAHAESFDSEEETA